VLAIADVPPPAADASGISVGLAGDAQADARTSSQATGAGRKNEDITLFGASNAPEADSVFTLKTV
jgi:hypothetical protein